MNSPSTLGTFRGKYQLTTNLDQNDCKPVFQGKLPRSPRLHVSQSNQKNPFCIKTEPSSDQETPRFGKETSRQEREPSEKRKNKTYYNTIRTSHRNSQCLELARNNKALPWNTKNKEPNTTKK